MIARGRLGLYRGIRPVHKGRCALCSMCLVNKAVASSIRPVHEDGAHISLVDAAGAPVRLRPVQSEIARHPTR